MNEMMPQYLARLAELYERQGQRIQLMDNKFWLNNRGIIVPIGPIHLNYSISEDQAHQLMKKFRGALLVRYTEGFKGPSVGEDWYAVICDKFQDLGSFHHENRRQINKGLKYCEVRQVAVSYTHLT